jgi:ABC-2 type transport system ATP-binding protein
MTGTVLETKGARKTYSGNTIALDGVDLDLREGEWLGLLGPNGAGKTTLIRAIAGRVKLNEGSVRVLDREVSRGGREAVEARAQIGIVPQEIALYGNLTARENLEVFASLSGLAGAQHAERTNWALDFTGLAERADDLVKTFSGGMKRRLNIAASVMHRPKIVLLDEPTVGVDPQSRERIWSMLRDLRAEGASLLLTSHQLDEVEKLCERIVIIDHGKVIAEGSLDQLIERTIGRGRLVTLFLDRPASQQEIGIACTVQGEKVSCSVNDVAAELPAILERVSASNRRVRDVQLTTPSLQSVFIHLTGRELRE